MRYEWTQNIIRLGREKNPDTCTDIEIQKQRRKNQDKADIEIQRHQGFNLRYVPMQNKKAKTKTETCTVI